MSITKLAASPEAVVGLLGFGALFFAAVAVFRDYLRAYSDRASDKNAYVPIYIPPYIPYRIDLAQRYITSLILAIVCLALCFIFIYVISNCLEWFTTAFYTLFSSTLLLTFVAFFTWLWIGSIQLKEMEITRRVEKVADRLFLEDLGKVQEEEEEEEVESG